jgi:hypothetical protein
VTRGTRPKKTSSSRGFACEARGALGAWGAGGSGGSWGSKTEILFSLFLFKPATTTKNKLKVIFYYYYFFKRLHPCGRSPSERTADYVRWGRGTGGGKGGEGE